MLNNKIKIKFKKWFKNTLIQTTYFLLFIFVFWPFFLNWKYKILFYINITYYFSILNLHQQKIKTSVITDTHTINNLFKYNLNCDWRSVCMCSQKNKIRMVISIGILIKSRCDIFVCTFSYYNFKFQNNLSSVPSVHSNRIYLATWFRKFYFYGKQSINISALPISSYMSYWVFGLGRLIKIRN